MVPKRGRVDQLKTTDGIGNSGSSPSSGGATPDSLLTVDKRLKTQGIPELQLIVTNSASANNIFLPPGTLLRGLFTGKNPLLLHMDEAKHIISWDNVTPGRDLLEDAEGVMRILAASMTLNAQKTCPQKDFDALKAQLQKLKLEHDNLESEFEAYKDKYVVKARYVEDLCKANDKIKGMEEEEMRMRKWIAELEASCLLTKDEREEKKAFLLGLK